ncbi:GNAT family N-acetyltransferase [Pedobacter caeni]|uniref:Ribosomal-protein-alanine N-acetyltransferase n=1 Tax=Pedobacter caeni TaxID=288992 RepID=A0A1M5JYZ2_9SPHI|nr:GNAT family N-acetyltransferase [Pedobacter caeni]SHG45605.1 ribosomal-protein-alanine N-acetyltransferase [Pedobacter caeni]
MEQDILKLQLSQVPELESERLFLREQTLNDAAALFKIRSNEAVMKYIPRPRPQSIEEVKAFIQEVHQNFLNHQSLGWAISLKESPELLIGFIGLWNFDCANFRAEIGYLLDPEYWGKGIAGEALSLATDFGFREIGLHSVCAVVAPENLASSRLLLKHGYVKEAYFKEDFYYNGVFLDSEIYSKLNHS